MQARKLLVIEDDVDIGVLVCRIAKDLGLQAELVTGTAAASAYKLMQPEVIVLDIMMPGTDGLEVLQFLKHEQSPARIILLSGSPEAYRRIAQNLGLNSALSIEANISKPFRAADLRLVLERAMMMVEQSASRADS